MKNGCLEIDVEELVGCLKGDQREEFMRSLVWTPEVFDDIVDAITSEPIVSSWFYSLIFKARERLLASVGELAKRHFASLLHELAHAKLAAARWERAYWRLHRAWPRSCLDEMPHCDEPYEDARWPTCEQAEAEMAAREGQDHAPTAQG